MICTITMCQFSSSVGGYIPVEEGNGIQHLYVPFDTGSRGLLC